MSAPADKPNLRQLAKARTRQKVLAAAKALFETEGYEAATIREIAMAAGMSTGAIFANWNDKAELYREIFGRPPLSNETGQRLLIAARCALGALTGNMDGDLELGEPLELLRAAINEAEAV